MRRAVVSTPTQCLSFGTCRTVFEGPALHPHHLFCRRHSREESNVVPLKASVQYASILTSVGIAGIAPFSSSERVINRPFNYLMRRTLSRQLARDSRRPPIMATLVPTSSSAGSECPQSRIVALWQARDPTLTMVDQIINQDV